MNYAYDLIPVSVGVIFLYIITWGLAKTGGIRITTHRQFWNALLLITFLVTGILGLLLVIQINYKLPIPWIKKVVQWHVDFGIAMAFIAFLHFIRHIRYYTDSLRQIGKPAGEYRETAKGMASDVQPMEEKQSIAALMTTGFTSIAFQLIMVRELLGVFQGNELVIGMVFCTWMLLIATGARFGKRMAKLTGDRELISRLFILAGFLPILTVLLLHLIESRIFLPGTSHGIVTAFVFCLCLLLPFCLVSGSLFVLIASTLPVITGNSRLSEAYGWESAGSIIAGLLFSVLLVFVFNGFQVLALILLVNLTLFTWIKPLNNPKTWLISGSGCILSLFLLFSPADRWIRSMHFKNQELLYSRDTPFGNLSVTETADQYNFYENGNLLFSTNNQIMCEEAVHFALLQHARPETIMIVSGGMAGMAREAIKHTSIRQIDYIEINPWIVGAERMYSDSGRIPQLNVITKDARRWIGKTDMVYDVMIVNTPDPHNAQINRYYTHGFFTEVRQVLRPDGVFMISLSPTMNYMSHEAREINRTIYHTLRKVFSHVVVIPGERNYFIASADELHIGIARSLALKGIQNDYIQPGYIDDELLKQQSDLIMNEITGGEALINHDLAPLAYFIQIRYWLSVTGEGWTLPLLVLILMLILLALRKINPVSAGIFTGGFSGASVELLIIIMFQILYGYVYQMLGIIVALYMAGLTAGTMLRKPVLRYSGPRSYMWLQFILLLLVLLIPVVLNLIGYRPLPDWTGQVLLIVLNFLTAFVTGLQFNMASHLEHHHHASMAVNLYSIDLAGAASGTLIVSMVLFPLLGLQYTCLLIALLNLAGIAVMFVSRKKYR